MLLSCGAPVVLTWTLVSQSDPPRADWLELCTFLFLVSGKVAVFDKTDDKTESLRAVSIKEPFPHPLTCIDDFIGGVRVVWTMRRSAANSRSLNNTLCVQVWCSVAMCDSMLQCVCCCVTVWCSVLQCDAVCCSYCTLWARYPIWGCSLTKNCGHVRDMSDKAPTNKIYRRASSEQRPRTRSCHESER